MTTLDSILSTFTRTITRTAKTLILPLLLGFPSLTVAAPNVGDPAPDFQLPGSDGNTYSVSQFTGHKPVVIAFFPKAFTGG